jgi:type III secretory pathway component EscU
MGPTSNVRKGAIQNAKKNATTNRPKKNKATTSAKILALIQDFSFKTKMVSQGRRRLQLLELMIISLNRVLYQVMFQVLFQVLNQVVHPVLLLVLIRVAHQVPSQVRFLLWLQ